MDDLHGFDERTALSVIDVQNDFAHPGGTLYVDEGDGIIPHINALIRQARQSSSFVVYTQDWHPPDTPHFEPYGGRWPVHCVRGTWGAELHEGLYVDGPVVRKGTRGEDGYSGFTARDVDTGVELRTGLEDLLRDQEIERVVVVGLAHDVCVKATALDAQRLGFEAGVDLRATRPVNVRPDDHHRANAEMFAAGVDLRPLPTGPFPIGTARQA
jgi:nicotinamidase/pyrazinamidase